MRLAPTVAGHSAIRYTPSIEIPAKIWYGRWRKSVSKIDLEFEFWISHAAWLNRPELGEERTRGMEKYKRMFWSVRIVLAYAEMPYNQPKVKIIDFRTMDLIAPSLDALTQPNICISEKRE